MLKQKFRSQKKDIWLTYSGICSPTTEIDLTSTFLLNKQIILICKDSSSTYHVINSLPFKSGIFSNKHKECMFCLSTNALVCFSTLSFSSPYKTMIYRLHMTFHPQTLRSLFSQEGTLTSTPVSDLRAKA